MHGLDGGQGAVDGGFADHPQCVSASGVRLCGGDPPCPELPAPVCPGYGCQRSADIDSGAPASGGICLADLQDQGRYPCFACDDGDACITRPNGDLVCVPLDVCHALFQIGVRDVCRYADKTPYDDRPLDSSGEPCPTSLFGPLCGGACGKCGQPAAVCSGRSATRRFGFCEGTLNGSPDAIRTCSLPATGGLPTVWCDPYYPDNWACAVYRNGDGSDAVAKRYAAACMSLEDCKKLRGPVGLECYDRFGSLVP